MSTAHILTAQPAAMGLALQEAGNPRVIRQLEQGVALCEGVGSLAHPFFLRHICPADVPVLLNGTRADLPALQAAFAPLVIGLAAAGGSFSVQSRIVQGYRPAYKRYDVNTALADMAQAAGMALDVKDPAQVVSVTLAEGMGWLGVSRAADNLSAWAGGKRRYKWETGQISRAEFKLLEALEAFAIETSDGERALDLGAAPGGWTRILRRRGLYVTAVDPAALDARIARDRRVTHYRGTAQTYFLGKPQVHDLMVNDMKMDSEQSATLVSEGAFFLRPGGIALLTLKLPEDAATWLPRLTQARDILSGAYEEKGVRQLFHNRNEVTLCLSRR